MTGTSKSTRQRVSVRGFWQQKVRWRKAIKDGRTIYFASLGGWEAQAVGLLPGDSSTFSGTRQQWVVQIFPLWQRPYFVLNEGCSRAKDVRYPKVEGKATLRVFWHRYEAKEWAAAILGEEREKSRAAAAEWPAIGELAGVVGLASLALSGAAFYLAARGR